MKAYFFFRERTIEAPAGWTVSRRQKLPEGEFGITEYKWGKIALWFVDRDNFTSDEREAVYLNFLMKHKSR